MPLLTVQRQKQKSLLGVMALVLTITSLVVYFGFLRRGAKEPGVIEKEDGIFKGTREIKLNIGLLEDERFKTLAPYEKIPRDIETGRNNPFVLYSIAEPPIKKRIKDLQKEISPVEGEVTNVGL